MQIIMQIDKLAVLRFAQADEKKLAKTAKRIRRTTKRQRPANRPIAET
jgi:hypothetical protein